MANVSFPPEKKLYGISVRKLRLGRFLEALETLGALPGVLLEQCFPGRTLEGALAVLSACDGETMRELLTTALRAAPEELVSVLASLLGVTADTLTNNDAIGPTELLELFEAFAEVNGLGNFMAPARRIASLFAGTARSKTGQPG